MDVRFTIEYYTKWGESLVLISGGREYPMRWAGNGIWEVTIRDCTRAILSDYTYIVMEDGLQKRSEWEHHHSRMAAEISDRWLDCPIPGCRFERRHSAGLFDRPGFRGAGVAVPLFSLRTEKDFGIGDFRDLRPLVDWASATGMCIIQLLPVNDTTRNACSDGSYPYSPVSSFALNPLYIRLQDIGIEEDEAFAALRTDLNKCRRIDYRRVYKEKMRYLRAAYATRGERDMAGGDFRKFCRCNESWLDEYCSFCALREYPDKRFYAWVQFHLDRQFSEEAAYAHRKNVYLKGDLPIGVSRDSADCKCHPELFNLDANAGAPPDSFSAEGQNWGFPTYNWDAMAADGYRWWKARLRKMAEYFDAFRIDHILGFFRIWEIPSDAQSALEGHFSPALPYPADEISRIGLPAEGLFHEDPHHPGMYQPLIRPAAEGLTEEQKSRFDALYNDFFYHRNNELWSRSATVRLPHLLCETGMLACGEDLGMVPDCVPGVMERERILSLRMRGMESAGEWREMSVCATSSHDMGTLRMQCDTDPSPSACRKMLAEYLDSPSMLAIFPIQDWLSPDRSLRLGNRNAERINNPAENNRQWRYRMHFPLERLLSAEGARLNAVIRELLDVSGRRQI